MSELCKRWRRPWIRSGATKMWLSNINNGLQWCVNMNRHSEPSSLMESFAMSCFQGFCCGTTDVHLSSLTHWDVHSLTTRGPHPIIWGVMIKKKGARNISSLGERLHFFISNFDKTVYQYPFYNMNDFQMSPIRVQLFLAKPRVDSIYPGNLQLTAVKFPRWVRLLIHSFVGFDRPIV